MAEFHGGSNSSQWKLVLKAWENSYDINSNTSNVTVEVWLARTSSYYGYNGGNYSGSVTVNGEVRNYSGSVAYPTGIGTDGIKLQTLYFTVGHNADGTKTTGISASFSASGWTPTSAWASGDLPLTTIPRQANITSAPDFNDEQNPTIGYNNSAGNSVSSLQACISFTGANDDIKYRDISKTGNSYTFNLTEEERNVLRKRATGTELNVIFFVKTVIGSNTFYSTSKKKLTIINANPSDFDFDYEDIGVMTPNGRTTTELTGDPHTIIKWYSDIKVKITSLAQSKKCSTISYYQADDVKTYYNNQQSVELLLKNYTKTDITVNAVDSRSLGTTKKKDVTKFIDYSDVWIKSLSLARSDNGVGQFVTLNFDGTFWNNNFGNVQNYLTAYYKFKKIGSDEYIDGITNITPNTSANTFSFAGMIAGNNEQNGFDINDSYEFVVTVYDRLGFYSYTGILGTGTPAIAVYKNHASLGGKYDTSLGGTQVWGDFYVNGSGMNDYSTEEQLIGKWIDGSNLYRKTIVISSLPNATSETYSHEIENFKNGFFDVAHSYTQQSDGYKAPMPYINPTDYSRSVFIYDLDSTSFKISTSKINRSGWSAVVTLLYTKNSD